MHLQNSIIAGWRSGLSRLAHNQEIAGSNPAPATLKLNILFIMEKLEISENHRSQIEAIFDEVRDGAVAEYNKGLNSLKEMVKHTNTFKEAPATLPRIDSGISFTAEDLRQPETTPPIEALEDFVPDPEVKELVAETEASFRTAYQNLEKLMTGLNNFYDLKRETELKEFAKVVRERIQPKPKEDETETDEAPKKRGRKSKEE